MPSYSSEDIIVSEAHVLTAPLATALPDETTVDYDDHSAWPAGWEVLGYTTTGISIGYSYDTFSVEVQQTNSRIKERKTSETVNLTFSLAQIAGDNVALAWGGTATDTAAGVSQKAWTRIVGGGDTVLPEAMYAIEGYRVDADDNVQPVRFFLYKGTAVASGDTVLDKNATTVIPLTISGLADTSKPAGSQIWEMHIVRGDATA